MKSVLKVVTLFALVSVLVPNGVIQAAEKKSSSEVVMKLGNKVHLFHSSSVEVQKDIVINDVLSVYRVSGKASEKKEVGAVKVLSFIGEHYFEAEIVKGEIKAGDIAQKNASSLLVQPKR